MARLTGKERAVYVQNMFTRIAGKYDLMNRLMTGFQDVRWRQQVIHLAKLSPGARMLDLGAGTGDLAREALRQQAKALVTAADFTIEMMRTGTRLGTLAWCGADALELPFHDETFDAVVSGFLMRNVIDLQKGIQEQYRVLRKGGRIVILDTTRPKRNLLSPLIWIHMHWVIPTLGWLFSGAREAYAYLPETSEGFVTAERLGALLAVSGFQRIGFRRLMFGTIALHWAEK